ncbi:MAG: SGNH/GDSL hydrolase family protein [Lachnospiraceae bacterium]|nr:SGNH/GDSL hydrolase family protein [Lachnospiraceae bacterium]
MEQFDEKRQTPASQKSGQKRPTSSKGTNKRRRKKRKKGGLSGHTIFFIVLGILFLITIIRLIVWNRGTKSGYDPNETTTEFDVELLDYIQPLDPAVLEGREDDGVTTILALGNDPLSDERGKNGLAALLEEKTDSTILNAAFPGSTIAMKNPEYENSYPLDGLSLYWTTAALVNQNFDLMDVVVSDMNSKSAAAALETLKEVDPEKLDAIIILYDLQDYIGKRIVYDENNDVNLNTVYGALNGTIRLIQQTWPHIRIYFLSPTYGTYTEGDGTVIDADMDDLGNGTLVDYINWELEASRSNGISFIDTYYGAVTMEDEDCLTDGFHLNEKGREKVAARVAQVLAPNK